MTRKKKGRPDEEQDVTGRSQSNLQMVETTPESSAVTSLHMLSLNCKFL